MSDSRVLWSSDGDGIATLTLNRPERRNALDEALGDEFAAALEQIAGEPRVRVLVLEAAGPAFCAGGDLGMLRDLGQLSPEESRVRMMAFYRRFLRLAELEIPSIAAIHGAAMGAGLAIALACDLRVVGSKARVGLNFVRVGISPGMGTTFFLPRLVGPEVAADLLLTGRVISGEEARRLGLCQVCVPGAEVADRARALARELALGAPVAVRAARRALGRDLAGLQAALAEEAAAQAVCYPTADLREGVAAALQRRPPRFEGR